MMTYAEELRLEGENKGKIKGKLEIIENLLKMGMTWTLIEQATEINQAQYHEYKRQFAHADTVANT